MALTEERKQELTSYLRGTSVAKENITPEYRKCLELADKETFVLPVGADDDVTVYVFTAKNRTANCPVHINIHGGGFVRPHVERDEIYSSKVADAIRGIVVDVDYKLAPEYPYPTAFDEAYEVGRWTFSKCREWDADETRVSMGGHSAGANLTAAVALKANQTKDFALCLQVLDYGAFDMVTDPADKKEALTNMIPIERCRMFTEAYTDGDLSLASEAYCSPLMATDEMLKGLPEALVIAAGLDNFRFEDADYAARMGLAGVKVTFKCFTESRHGFIVHCTEEWEAGQEMVIDAIRKAKL
ncbi:MAG: alpha/beta hydrolase [Clostridiales bacterium]|nr:alpha/beta hydrolase [Clostridiales bacterium]